MENYVRSLYTDESPESKLVVNSITLSIAGLYDRFNYGCTSGFIRSHGLK